MSVNANTLLAGGISLTYGSMNELQIAAARMEIEGLQFYKEMVPLMKELNQAQFQDNMQKAHDQVIQGVVSGLSDAAQAVMMIGATKFAADEIDQTEAAVKGPQQFKLDAEADPVTGKLATGEPMADVVGVRDQMFSDNEVELNDMNQLTGEHRVIQDKNATAHLEAQRSDIVQKSNTRLDEQTSKEIQTPEEAEKDKAKRAKNINEKWNTYGEIAKQIVSGFGQAGTQAQAANVTKDDAQANYDSGTMQTVKSDMDAINSFNQSQSGKEQAATQALLAMIQVSSHA